jgi:hypothetical protein
MSTELKLKKNIWIEVWNKSHLQMLEHVDEKFSEELLIKFPHLFVICKYSVMFSALKRINTLYHFVLLSLQFKIDLQVYEKLLP